MQNDERLMNIDELLPRLERMESLLLSLVSQRLIKDWYTTSELGGLLDKSEYTVREWCRQGRVRASKRPCGRGRAREWVVAHAELERVRNEGLLPSRTVKRSGLI